MQSSFRLILVSIALSSFVLAQQAPPPSSSTVDDDFIQKQFGSTCKLMPGPPQLKADLDGDGIEDLVVAGRCKNPLADQAEDNFTVIDPYNQFYGYGNTKITTQFASEDPEVRGLVLLVIHGAGAEAWRAATPKAKFVIINLPFQTDCGEKADGEEEDCDGHLRRGDGWRSHDLCHFLGRQEISLPADRIQHGAVKPASDVGPRASSASPGFEVQGLTSEV